MTIRIYDEATKKALAGLLPFAPGAYITTGLDCFDHIPEASRPVFRLRDFTSKQFYEMRAVLDAGGDVSPELMLKTLQEGAMGPWDNLVDSTFQEIPFSLEAIANLPPRWIEAFYWACANLCSPKKLEKEVLESLRPSTSESSSNPAPAAGALPG